MREIMRWFASFGDMLSSRVDGVDNSRRRMWAFTDLQVSGALETNFNVW